MRIARRVDVVVLALCFLCLLAFLASSPASASDGVGVSAASTPFHWKAEKAGVGFVEDFTSRYVLSSGPGNEDWTDYPARDLFLYDCLLGSTHQLTSTPSTEASAALWEHEVIYATGPNPYAEEVGPWWVSLYDISTGDTRVVSLYEDASGVWDVQAADGYAVWTVSVGDDTDIWLYDFASGIPVCLSSEGTHRVHGLCLADGELAWIDGSSLLLYDLASRVRTVVSTGEGDSAYHVSVVGGRVGWLRGWELRLYGIASQETQVVTDRADDFDLSAEDLVWMETSDAEADIDTADIYLRDLANGTQQRLTNNSVADMFPQVSDRFVVWMRGDYHGGSLFACDLQSGLTTTITREGAAGFRLEDDWVAWNQWRGLGDAYLARPVVFPDIGPDDSLGRVIEDLAGKGIVGGYPDGTFRPQNPVLRAQFAKMIVLGLDLEVTEGGTALPFKDVEKPADNLYPDDYVAVAALNGLIQGYPGGYFKPYVDLTRAQLLTIVVRAAEKFKPAALTTPPPGWKGVLPATDATHGRNIARAEYSGLLAGISLPAFSVTGKATRGELAQVLYNLASDAVLGMNRLTPEQIKVLSGWSDDPRNLAVRSYNVFGTWAAAIIDNNAPQPPDGPPPMGCICVFRLEPSGWALFDESSFMGELDLLPRLQSEGVPGEVVQWIRAQLGF